MIAVQEEAGLRSANSGFYWGCVKPIKYNLTTMSIAVETMLGFLLVQDLRRPLLRELLHGL